MTREDSFHSNGDIEINGGSFTAAAGEDGFHADNNLIINGGSITVSQSYEGLEGQKVTVTGGNIDITASDDGINAAGSSSSSSTGGRPGSSDSNALITIGGGYIVVNASGDGVDSNGNIVISGGALLVSGPADNGNAAFDYDGEATVSGGTVILCGNSGMSQGFSDESEQLYKEQGLEAFEENERLRANQPMNQGPFAKFLKTISDIQKDFPQDQAPIRTALVTARSAPAHERVIRTLRAWNVRIDEAFFLGGISKSDVLKAFGAQIFFDDQAVHTKLASQVVPSARVPYKKKAAQNKDP